VEDRENLPSEERDKAAEGDDVQGHSFANESEREKLPEGDDVEGHSFKAEDSKAEDGV
jgi:hypothetical protein